MKYEIKFSVNICNIDEKRKEHEYIKERLFKLERMMASMLIDRQVGLYANMLDKYINLKQMLSSMPTDKLEATKKEIVFLEKEIIASRRNYNIIRYRTVRNEYDSLKEKIGDYYKAINIDLRDELKDKNLPNIYIYQENNKIPSFKHIIIPNKEVEVITDIGYSDNLVVYPLYGLDSNREYRHFYNKTSFKYLEELSQDYSHKLNNKNIGKVKIKKM